MLKDLNNQLWVVCRDRMSYAVTKEDGEQIRSLWKAYCRGEKDDNIKSVPIAVFSIYL